MVKTPQIRLGLGPRALPVAHSVFITGRRLTGHCPDLLGKPDCFKYNLEAIDEIVFVIIGSFRKSVQSLDTPFVMKDVFYP